MNPPSVSREVAQSAHPSGREIIRLWPVVAEKWTTGFPRLTEVQFAYHGDKSTAPKGPRTILESAPKKVPPERWEAGGVTGYIIREYVRSEYDEAGQFWHVRMLRAEDQDIDDGTLPESMLRGAGHSHMKTSREQRKTQNTSGKRRWVVYTLFGGRTVPAEVVSAVYAIEGISMDWTEGGRRRTLKPESWTVLDTQWKDAEGAKRLR